MASIKGTLLPDVLSGTTLNDLIEGLAGNDLLSGLAGNDTLDGGTGSDSLVGLDGDDVLAGGGGNDSLAGGNGIDVVVFSGTIDEYDKIAVTGGWQIIHARGSGVDGTDFVAADVESLLFSGLAAVGTGVLQPFSAVNTVPVATSRVNTVAESSVTALAFSATDADAGDSLTYRIVSAPAKGRVYESGGAWFFDPEGSYETMQQGQTLSFDLAYEVVDAHGAVSAPSKITLTVAGVNDAPVAVDTTLSLTEDQAASLGLTASDIDSGAVLTFELGPGAPVSVPVTIAGAQLTVDPRGLMDTLAEGEQTTLYYDFRAHDQHGAFSGYATASVTITGVNDAPTAGTVAQTVTAGTMMVNVSLAGDDADSDDNAGTLSYFVMSGAGDLSAAITAGTLTARTQNTVLSLSGAYQSLGEGESAVETFRYLARDQHGGLSAESTIAITVTGVNDAPVIDRANPLASFDQFLFLDPEVPAAGAQLSGQLLASDADLHDVLGWSIGTGGQTLVQGQYGTLTLTAATGAWTYTIAADADFSAISGGVVTEEFDIRVTDNRLSDLETLNLSIILV